MRDVTHGAFSSPLKGEAFEQAAAPYSPPSRGPALPPPHEMQKWGEGIRAGLLHPTIRISIAGYASDVVVTQTG